MARERERAVCEREVKREKREREHRCCRRKKKRERDFFLSLFLTFDLDGGTGHLARVP